MDIAEYEKYLASPTISRHPWEIARARIIRYLLQKNIPNIHHISDIGSGDAYLLQTLLPHWQGVEFTAIDPAYTPALLERIHKEVPSGKIAFYRGLEELNDQSRTTDCFLLLDMLEHCERDSETLGKVLTYGHPSRPVSLLITVPAFQGLFSRHDRELGHFRRYDAHSLIALCKQHQLKVTHYGYFFFSLLPVRIYQLITEKIHPKRDYHTVTRWNTHPLFTRLFTAILWADFRLSYGLAKLHIKIPGLSLFCVCQS